MVLYVCLIASLLVGVGLLHLLPRFGTAGKTLSNWLCCAPGIDLALAYFMLLPLIVGAAISGGRGISVAFLAEMSSLFMWVMAHEFLHREQVRQANIHRTLSSIVGKWENHFAVWITALAVPIFWLIRAGELLIYPPLTKLVKLPKYNEKDWVNVSRQKFVGLIGYDLIWCLYCDWMTGVWSLGTEMLRNVESFWCPIRFHSEKKCENCQIDFPDVTTAWVPADGTVEDVAELLTSKYSSTQEERSWYGHSCRECQEAPALGGDLSMARDE